MEIENQVTHLNTASVPAGAIITSVILGLTYF